MKCPNCGKVGVDNPAFCRGCGQKLTPGDSHGAHALPLGVTTRGKNTPMPIVGGVLCLVAGFGSLILGLNQIIGSIGIDDRWLPQNWAGFALGLGFMVLGLIDVAGSSHALARRSYPMAIAGAVCALLALFLTLPVLAVLGVPALILVAISRSEFGYKAEGVKCPDCGGITPKDSMLCTGCGRQIRV